MPRYNLRNLSPKYQKAVLNEFYKSILYLKNDKEAEAFFKELFDLNEVGMFARRVIAAKLLFEDKTYQEISAALKMGMDTIARVDKKLRDGTGYKLIINRLDNKARRK